MDCTVSIDGQYKHTLLDCYFLWLIVILRQLARHQLKMNLLSLRSETAAPPPRPLHRCLVEVWKSNLKSRWKIPRVWLAAPALESSNRRLDNRHQATKMNRITTTVLSFLIGVSTLPLAKCSLMKVPDQMKSFSDNSDLNLKIDTTDFCSAKAMSERGFGYIWAGARATYGATVGKVCFEVRSFGVYDARVPITLHSPILLGQVRIDNNCPTSHLEGEETPNVLRVGWSTDSTGLQLGEEPLSFGYGGTAKSSTNCKFRDYGLRFGDKDVIGCFLVSLASNNLLLLWFFLVC